MRLVHVAAVAAVLCTSSFVAATQVPPKGTPSAQKERRICRTSTDTGSFARRTRTCLTTAQWRRADEGNRELAREIQENNRGAPSGGN